MAYTDTLIPSIEGYGARGYRQTTADEWTTPDEQEWGYILADRESSVIYGEHLVKVIAWDGAEPAWDAIEERAYALA